MKKLLWSFLVLVGVLLLFACQNQDTTSISERVDQFESDINNDRANAFTNLHPDIASLYADPGDWEPPFTTGVTYTFNVTSVGSSSAQANIVASNPADSIHNETATFQMKEDGEDNWKILRLDISNFGNVVQSRLTIVPLPPKP